MPLEYPTAMTVNQLIDKLTKLVKAHPNVGNLPVTDYHTDPTVPDEDKVRLSLSEIEWDEESFMLFAP